MNPDESRSLVPIDPRRHPPRPSGLWSRRAREEWPASSRMEPRPAAQSAPISALLLESFLTHICASFDRLSLRVSRLGLDVQAVDRHVRELADMMEERPVIRYGTLSDLGERHASLNFPLPIVIEEYPDEVIARWPEIEATGSGSSEPEAIWRLKQEILDLMQELSSSSPDELGPEPAQSLRILTRYIAPNG